MNDNPAFAAYTHVVDILGNVTGRDQPIMLLGKAIELVSTLGDDVFRNDDVVFFDPFCKAGEILLACAILRCRAKLANCVSDVCVDEAHSQAVKAEIYGSKRYFALAPDERHYRLSLRTFLGNTFSHDPKFNHIIRNGHYLSEIVGRLDRKRFETEFLSMLEYIKQQLGNKKIVAVGNPPYQEADGGFGGSAKAIYNFFAETLMDCRFISEFVLVIPSRWFSAGKGVEGFREKIIRSGEIKSVRHFKNSKEVFPTVDVLGGVCFLHYDSHFDGTTLFLDKDVKQTVDFSAYDIILDDPQGYSLVEKIKKRWEGEYVSNVAWSGKPFGIRTFYFKRKNQLTAENENALPCYSKGRKIRYANKEDIVKNNERIDEWKVAIPCAYAPGSKTGVRRVTLPINQYFVIPPGYITTETYSIVGSFTSKLFAENFLSYLQTDFARYLLGLRKITQHIPRDRWNWVPYMDVNRQWTDQDLFEYFDLSDEEQAHIKRKVREWS